jgi:hypothetical protein
MSDDVVYTYQSILNHISVIEDRIAGISSAPQLTGSKEAELLLMLLPCACRPWEKM